MWLSSSQFFEFIYILFHVFMFERFIVSFFLFFCLFSFCVVSCSYNFLFFYILSTCVSCVYGVFVIVVFCFFYIIKLGLFVSIEPLVSSCLVYDGFRFRYVFYCLIVAMLFFLLFLFLWPIVVVANYFLFLFFVCVYVGFVAAVFFLFFI